MDSDSTGLSGGSQPENVTLTGGASGVSILGGGKCRQDGRPSPPDGGSGATGDGGAALPCLNSINSIITEAVASPRREYDFRHNYVLKQEFALKFNVSKMIEYHGATKTGFLTLTFPDDLQWGRREDWREAQRRLNSFLTNFLKKFVVEYINVIEPQASGRLHCHLVVILREDIQTGFDWSAFKACQDEYRLRGKTAAYWRFRRTYVSSASPFLRGLWSSLREGCRAYGFGRHELLPLKSTGDAVGTYIGKYLSAESSTAPSRVRRVRVSNESRRARMSFSWSGIRQGGSGSVAVAVVTTTEPKGNFKWGRPAARRAWIGFKASRLGFFDSASAAAVLGSRWVYDWREFVFSFTWEEFKAFGAVCSDERFELITDFCVRSDFDDRLERLRDSRGGSGDCRDVGVVHAGGFRVWT